MVLGVSLFAQIVLNPEHSDVRVDCEVPVGYASTNDLVANLLIPMIK